MPLHITEYPIRETALTAAREIWLESRVPCRRQFCFTDHLTAPRGSPRKEPSMYKKRKGVPYIITVDGEPVEITDEMVAATDPKNLREYLRMLWAQEHRERREYRCQNAKGVRCQKNCHKCKESQSGRLLSLEALIDGGVPFEDTFSVEADVEQRETITELYAALAKLDTLSHQIIELLYFGGQTEREVAVIVGLSQNGVHQRKMKALEELRKLLVA